MVRLGYHPATWGGKLECLWRGIDCMSACRWDGFEYRYGDITEWYDRPDEFRRKLDACDLTLSGLYLPSGFRNADEITAHRAQVEAAARFCVAVGCSFILLDGGARHEGGQYSDADIRRVADAANRCGEICRAQGLLCSWHQHWGSMFEYQAQFDRLMAMTDPALVLCTPDTAQLSLGDFDVAKTVRRYADRISYIHLKDLDANRRFIELGKGMVDLVGAWQALGAERYNGWVVVDLDYTSLAPEESCRINKAYLNAVLGIRGERDRDAQPASTEG